MTYYNKDMKMKIDDVEWVNVGFQVDVTHAQPSCGIWKFCLFPTTSLSIGKRVESKWVDGWLSEWCISKLHQVGRKFGL